MGSAELMSNRSLYQTAEGHRGVITTVVVLRSLILLRTFGMIQKGGKAYIPVGSHIRVRASNPIASGCGLHEINLSV